jgi:hypothetical protein
VLRANEAVAYHEGGRTIGRRSPERVYFAARNHLRLARRIGSRPAPLRAGLIVGLNAAYVLLSGETPRVRGLAALARGAWHHVRGRYGPALRIRPILERRSVAFSVRAARSAGPACLPGGQT